MGNMGLRDASGKEKVVIYFNALVRFAQFVVAVVVLGVYGVQKGYWLDHGLPGRIVSFTRNPGTLPSLTVAEFRAGCWRPFYHHSIRPRNHSICPIISTSRTCRALGSDTDGLVGSGLWSDESNLLPRL